MKYILTHSSASDPLNTHRHSLQVSHVLGRWGGPLGYLSPYLEAIPDPARLPSSIQMKLGRKVDEAQGEEGVGCPSLPLLLPMMPATE